MNTMSINIAGSDKVGEQVSAACRHRPQFVVLLIVNFVGADHIKDICLSGSKKFCRTLVVVVVVVFNL